MNGFTHTHLNILIHLSVDFISENIPTEYIALYSSMIIVIVVLIINAITILGNLIFLSLVTIQSFDVDKDNKPLEI